MRKKIVLYWPDWHLSRPSRERIDDLKLESLTLASLAGAIKEYNPISLQGNIMLRHLHTSEEDVDERTYLKANIEMVEKYNPDILCIGNWSANFLFSIEFVRNFKARNKDCIVIMGGHPATFITDEVFGIIPEANFLVRGEGEITFRDLIKKLVKGESTKNVKSISFKDKNGKVKHNPKRELIKNLDKLPLPDYSSFEKRAEESVYTVMTERGCFYHCNFCCARPMGGIGRLKSIERVIKEIELLDTDYIFFGSNNFTTKRNFVVKLSKYLGEKNIKWHCMSRVDTVDHELLQIMKAGGCDEISFGPESINPELLVRMNKTTKDRVKEYIKLCWDIPRYANNLGMTTRANVVIGFPYEKKEMLLKTLNYIVTLQKEGMKTHASTLAVYPGTDLWEDYKMGKIELVKRISYPVTFFEKKYNHLPWAYPDAWMPKNDYMSINEFSKLTYENWTLKIKND